VFFLIEGIRRKPVSRKVETAVHMTGFALLIGLMVFFTFQDVGRIIGG
jgi:regulator of sigma E protease